MITVEQIRAAAKGPVNDANMNSVLVTLDKFGVALGLDKRWRAVEYFAQIMHESGDFRYDREIWGPTPAQAHYDTRTDLGNTAARDGDGKLYAGRTAVQITGKANYAAFRDWCTKQGFGPPDFVASPDLVNTDPWEGLGPAWFWSVHGLNALADVGDIEGITKRINGGLNGFADRCEHFVRLALVVLGYAATDVRGFQKAAKLVVDGDAGPHTRMALHNALKAG